MLFCEKNPSQTLSGINIYQKETCLYPIKNKISFHIELRLPMRIALAALRDVNLDVQISWQAQHFECLQ